MEQKQRRGIRSEREQLLTLVNGWDPAGRLKQGGPRDEYDWIVDGLLNLLSRSAGDQEVVEFLESEIRQRFGETPANAHQFAVKAKTWFETRELRTET